MLGIDGLDAENDGVARGAAAGNVLGFSISLGS
jgi:hypothetical protein